MRFFYESNDLNETANITFIVKIRDFIAGANKGGLSLVGCLEWAQWNEIISEGAIFSPRTFALKFGFSEKHTKHLLVNVQSMMKIA